MAVLRTLIGEALRTTRLRQDRTLREVSAAARVSLGYLSEVERGQKEASSELLASICRALGVRLSDVLREVSESLVGARARARAGRRSRSPSPPVGVRPGRGLGGPVSAGRPGPRAGAARRRARGRRLTV